MKLSACCVRYWTTSSTFRKLWVNVAVNCMWSKHSSVFFVELMLEAQEDACFSANATHMERFRWDPSTIGGVTGCHIGVPRIILRFVADGRHV